MNFIFTIFEEENYGGSGGDVGEYGGILFIIIEFVNYNRGF